MIMNQFNYPDIKVLHLELTTKCNAACPQCARMQPIKFSATTDQNELTLNFIKKTIPIEFIKQLNKMFMCGNFGDPAVAKETLNIIRWFKEINPLITIGMNTNGGIRLPNWWSELGRILSNPTDYVVFSIDGLEDTNHLYRINVRWDKVMENSAAFIEAGGNAHWDMLVYAHNEHQVKLAENVARDMGFKWFRSKISRRELTAGLTYPKSNVKEVESGNIKCHAHKEGSIYVSANGYVLPCCFIGAEIFMDNPPVSELLPNNTVSLSDNTIEQIVHNFSKVEDTWEHTPLSTCKYTCSNRDNVTPFENQWKNEIKL